MPIFHISTRPGQTLKNKLNCTRACRALDQGTGNRTWAGARSMHGGSLGAWVTATNQAEIILGEQLKRHRWFSIHPKLQSSPMRPSEAPQLSAKAENRCSERTQSRRLSQSPDSSSKCATMVTSIYLMPWPWGAAPVLISQSPRTRQSLLQW
jgi:hypothetical protein